MIVQYSCEDLGFQQLVCWKTTLSILGVLILANGINRDALKILRRINKLHPRRLRVLKLMKEATNV
ncbi:hypothetical protein P5673_011874 [Acropora cervicornis]|uniref:Uncharacterized protein n=1 Tax=Acropora cervicornis TaxID=6130 RepID=A0AAD9QN92_ACRCE|nr:hypothetical protein P5673_011874 [Acropora cervicornis]